MILTNPIIEKILTEFSATLGKDYDKYRNHVYRIFMYCIDMDPNADHQERYAYASVFHDIGIWTHHTIDYIDPSIREAGNYLNAHHRSELIKDVSAMIFWHHKLTPFKGPGAGLIEVFRKADWIDVSLGIVAFGYSRSKITLARKVFPTVGFHKFLLKQIVQNLARHPRNPLPMFKK